MKLINAINKVKSQDKTRNAISNIYLDATEQKIVATDGNIMAVLSPSEPIPSSVVLDVPKISGKLLDINLDALTATNEKGLSAPCTVNENAQYPACGQVLPTEIEYTFYLDAKLLAKVVESLTTSKVTYIKIEVGKGKTPIRVTNASTDNYGVIMPLSGELYNEIKNNNK